MVGCIAQIPSKGTLFGIFIVNAPRSPANYLQQVDRQKTFILFYVKYGIFYNVVYNAEISVFYILD